MNKNILNSAVQSYIDANLKSDVAKIALAKPVFDNISQTELANQIAGKKKSLIKLPTWCAKAGIYYPPLLSLEQCSSERTAAYKSKLMVGDALVDLTSGFGVDSYYFAKQAQRVVSCEINPLLSEISAHNANTLGTKNISHVAADGMELIKSGNLKMDTIYIDPARRSGSSKVFRLQDCTPNIIPFIDLFLETAKRIIIKTAPFLDISAGLTALKHVSAIHIVSVKNECKELIWIIDKNGCEHPKIICAALNEEEKILSFDLNDLQTKINISPLTPRGYLYEPDAALLKSGAFNYIGQHFKLNKLQQLSHLYFSDMIDPRFPGRIFEIKQVLSVNELKKDHALVGNVLVRNFPDRAENLVKKYRVKQNHDNFLVFTQSLNGYIVIKARIIQHY